MLKLDFEPFPGLTSKHLQTVLSSLLPVGRAPPSDSFQVTLDDGDSLFCSRSTPIDWSKGKKTVLLVHGLGGSERSSYIIRIARALYERGISVVRVNLRGVGFQGAKRPYHAGTSGDILQVIKALEERVTVIGFSLGGNVVLKLAGELGSHAQRFVDRFIAVSPPFDLLQTVRTIQAPQNSFYHRYYLKAICRKAKPWLKEDVRSLYEFDDQVTGPLWGYSGANAYYESNSCKSFLSQIGQKTKILVSEDDPFISYNSVPAHSPYVEIYSTRHGGHLGFLGKKNFYWLDNLLVNWVEA